MNVHIHPQIRAHIDLWNAIQESGGEVTHKEFDPTVYLRRYETKSIQANAGDFAEIIGLLANFPKAACAYFFLREFRMIIVAWINSKAGRGLKITCTGREIEIRGDTDITKALELLEKLEEKAETKTN